MSNLSGGAFSSSRGRRVRRSDGMIFDSHHEAAKDAGVAVSTFTRVLDQGRVMGNGHTYERLRPRINRRAPSKAPQTPSAGLPGIDLNTIKVDVNCLPNTVYMLSPTEHISGLSAWVPRPTLMRRIWNALRRIFV